MKRLIFLVPIVVFILVGLFVSNGYNFQFGFGTKGFIRKTLEKGQEEGKIPRTKEEKERGRVFNVGKFDLSQAKYLFVSAKTSSGSSSVIAKSPAIYRDISSGTTQQSIFKIKEDGNIEEVKIYDDQGNVVDANVLYMVKMGTSYICVELELLQLQKRNKYLVRLEDGAAWVGEGLPAKDTNTDKVEYDDYGNYYYFLSTYTTRNNVIVKLKTADMSIKIMNAEDDVIPREPDTPSPFWVDKYGNILYKYYKNNQYGYRYRTVTLGGEQSSQLSQLSFSAEDIKDVFVNTDRTNICYIRTNLGTSFTIDYVNTGYGTMTSYIVTQFNHENIVKGYGYEGNILLMFDKRDINFTVPALLSFANFNLTNNTTDYMYDIPLSSFGVSSPDYDNDPLKIGDYFKNSFSYKIVNSTTVYVMFKTKDGVTNKYSFFIIHPNEQKFEEIPRTDDNKIKYEINANYYSNFNVDTDGSIVVSANDMQQEGRRVILKILPDGSENAVYTTTNVEIQYLTKVR